MGMLTRQNFSVHRGRAWRGLYTRRRRGTASLCGMSREWAIPDSETTRSMEFSVLHNRPPPLLLALDETREVSRVDSMEGRCAGCFETRADSRIFHGLAEVRAQLLND